MRGLKKVKIIKSGNPKEVEKEYANFYNMAHQDEAVFSISKPQFVFAGDVIFCIIEYEAKSTNEVK